MPNFTVRMLLTSFEPSAGISLKPFSHFTLGCTEEDQVSRIEEGSEILAKEFNGGISFKADDVINLASESKPLWAIKLNLGPKEAELRKLLGSQIDPIMCSESDGNLYLWDPDHVEGGKSFLKCPHITLGSKEEDRNKGLEILGSNFNFATIDYKKIGPHDPHFSKELIVKEELKLSHKLKI